MLKKPAENLKILVALSLVHFSGDFYSSFMSPLFPVFKAKLGLTLAQVGVLAGISRFLMFIVQPMSGYWADRHPSRRFILVGLMLPILFIPLTGWTAGFWGLFACICLGSAGSSMFHPPVTGMVPLYARRNLGLAMSIFNTSGTLAFSLGPIFITIFVARFGLEAMPLTVVLGLAVWVYLYIVLPMPQGDDMARFGFLETLRQSLGAVWRPILLIWIVMVTRALVGQSMLTFMPVLWVQQGQSLVNAGLLFSLFTLSGTVAGIFCGFLSDRIGFKPILWVTHGLMAPVLVLFLSVSGWSLYPATILAGGFNMASLPLGVVMAQKLAPKGRSMVASLMMGLAFGTGGILAPVVGKLGDMFGLHVVLLAIAGLPLLSLLPLYFIPEVLRHADDA